MEEFPKRIISVVPSQTELLFDLGLDEEVIGITKFCVHPESWFSRRDSFGAPKTRIGGTKTLNIEKIKSLQPDLILANKEENVHEQIEELQKHFPVYVSDIKTIDDAFGMMREVGEMVGRKMKAEILIEKIKNNFSQLSPSNFHLPSSVLYLIWNSPMMSVGGDTFISSMIEQAEFKNILHDKNRYPEISAEEIQELKPDFIFLSSEPFPFKQKNKEEFEKQFPFSKIVLVDGELFSWYGSRMKLAAEYFGKLNAELNL